MNLENIKGKKPVTKDDIYYCIFHICTHVVHNIWNIQGSVPGSGRSPGGGHGNSLQHSCWRTPRTEEPGGLESLGSQRVGHNRRDLACTHVPGKPHFTPELFNNPFCFCCQILSNLKVHSSLIFLQKEREIKY